MLAIVGTTISCGVLASELSNRSDKVRTVWDPVKFNGKPAGLPFYAPDVPSYPYFGGASKKPVLEQAFIISEALDKYIREWLLGEAPAQIPDSYLPNGYEKRNYKNFRLIRESEISLEKQWVVRKAEPIDRSRARGGFPDANVTYLVAPLYAPFGTKVIIEGEFPHCRFFDIQASPAFQPENYRYYQTFGVPEVPLVDIDINPSPGSLNPFLPGANRATANRKYRAEFLLAAGDPVALDEAFAPPYRGVGNTRHASGIQYQGPWGASKRGGHGMGVWDFGSIWIRYYAPDNKCGALAGVPLPKLSYELPGGEKYYIAIDQSGLEDRANRRVKLADTAPQEPPPRIGADIGWFKEWGIFRAAISGIAVASGASEEASKAYVRDLDLGVTGRSYDAKAPMCYEPSATSATYVNYLVRGMSLGPGKVAVLTGKLPTFPATRFGESIASKAQSRYWSLTGYAVPSLWESLDIALNPNAIVGMPVHEVMDDEIVCDQNQRFTIVFSRPQDKPTNAKPENGITWCEWGNRGEVSWTLRWLSVAPNWQFEKTPDEVNLPGRTTEWASSEFDKKIIGTNNHRGWLGEYLPMVHYMNKSDFEKMGLGLKQADQPVWRR